MKPAFLTYRWLLPAGAFLLVQVSSPAQTNTLAAPVVAAPDVTPAATPVDPAKVAEIKKLLVASGTAHLMDTMKDQMFIMMEHQHAGVPPHVWVELRAEMDDQGLLDAMIPIYDRHFSLEDLQALNAFYSTPSGQRMIAAMPAVMKESMLAGQDWGRQAVMKMQTKLQAERGTAGVAPGAAK